MNYKVKVLLLSFFAFITFMVTSNVYAASNPYGKYQSLYGITTVRCTWYAWQQAYEHTGVALPGWGNAQEWYNSAISAGYKVGSEAKPNSIAVWSSSDGYGHVGFVVSVDGNIMTVNEAGIVTEENEGIVNGSHKYTTAGNLIGFIYLDEAPSSSNNTYNNVTNNNTSNNSNQNNDTSKEELDTNNNLKELNIDIEDFVFDTTINDYILEVPYETQIIHITATLESDKATINGTGAKALKVGTNEYTITVTAEDGTPKEYHITIIRDELITKEDSRDTNTKNTSKYWIIGLISSGIILVVLSTVLIIKKKKRKVNQKGAKAKYKQCKNEYKNNLEK